MKKKPKPKPKMARIIVDSTDGSKDYFLPAEQAYGLYKDGLLAVDLTNSKGEFIYSDPKETCRKYCK